MNVVEKSGERKQPASLQPEGGDLFEVRITEHWETVVVVRASCADEAELVCEERRLDGDYDEHDPDGSIEYEVIRQLSKGGQNV